MVLFKIWGERNSGTTFLSELLKINNFSVYTQFIENNICYYWKHDIPDSNVKKLDNRVIDIFIFRNLNEWLPSMWQNPYHLKKVNNFNDFLISKRLVEEEGLYNYRDNKILNSDDQNKTIFEIRYYKFNKIYEYRKLNKDVIFINLNYLQNEDTAFIFLSTINKEYDLNNNNNFITSISNHTKINNIKVKNRFYDINIDDYKDTINLYKSQEIEEYIENLKFEIF